MCNRLTVVSADHCEDLPLHSTLSQGHWTQAKAELFGLPKATHLHFYVSREEARKMWPAIQQRVPATVLTVSFA